MTESQGVSSHQKNKICHFSHSIETILKHLCQIRINWKDGCVLAKMNVLDLRRDIHYICTRTEKERGVFTSFNLWYVSEAGLAVLRYMREGKMIGKFIKLARYVLIITSLANTTAFSQTSPQAATVSVGDTMTFWVYQSSYFYVGYNKIEAICRAVGEKCYIFVEKTRWNFGDVDSSDVATILFAFDNATVAVDSTAPGVLASTAGIYDKVTSVFGQPPDFDNDPRIYILLLDVNIRGRTGWQHLEESFFSPMAHYGFFNPIDEYSARVDSMSNEHEILYVDCVPTNPSSSGALASLAYNLQRMIHWYNDPNEERWLAEGCSMLAQFLCGYGVLTGYFPPMDPFVSITVYTDEWGDWTWQPSEVQNSMLLHFYFEKYGEPFISDLVADDAHQGVEAIDTTLHSLGFSKSFSEVFEDFTLTWYFLSLGLAADSSFFEGKYSLKYLTPEEVEGTIINSFLYWGLPGFLEPPYPYDWTSSWSAAFMCMTAPFSGDVDSVLVFNGEDGSEYSLVVIKAPNDWMQPLDPQSQIEFISLDSENRGYCDVSGFKTEYNTIYMAIVTRWLTGMGTLYISDDITPPDSLHVAVFHGPIDDRSLDVYVFSSEEIISGQRNVPIVEFTQGTITDTIALRRIRPYSPDPQPNEPHIYHGNYWLSFDGIVNVKVTGQDVSGNHAPDYRSSFTVDFVSAKRGGTISSPEGKLRLHIPENSLNKDIWVTVFPQDYDYTSPYQKEISLASLNSTVGDRSSVGNVYAIGPTGAILRQPAILILHFDEKDIEGTEGHLAIYRWESKSWTSVGGKVNRKEGSISVPIYQFGEYQIQAGPHNEIQIAMPSTFELGQNYPNPFNSTTSIQYSVIGDQSQPHVTLKIYNLLGQEVETLVDEVQEPGYYTVTWDASNMSSGIYFYRLTAASGLWQENKRMVFLK